MASLETGAFAIQKAQPDPSLMEEVLKRAGLTEIIAASQEAALPSHLWDHKSKRFEVVIPMPNEKSEFKIFGAVPPGVSIRSTMMVNGELTSVPVLLVGTQVEPAKGCYFSPYALSTALDGVPAFGSFALRAYNELFHLGMPSRMEAPPGELNPMI